MPSRIDKAVAFYCGRKLSEHGPSARGVDWKNAASQTKRFEQLAKLLPDEKRFGLNDLGCGYGAFFDYLSRRKFFFDYYGLDLSADMIDAANGLYQAKNVHFWRAGVSGLGQADYTVASGIFNVRLDFGRAAWEKYVWSALRGMDRASRKGFAFNVLSAYSDREKMRKDLYYADPFFYFDRCKKEFSKDVAMLHDYGLYEFTLLVRK